jgi:uncharacterized protein YidB (DUF937 family)
MGLLDQLGGQVSGGGIVNAVIQLINSQPGGLPGLVEKFQSGGLGEVVASWISTGRNLPVSADQISSILGSGALSEFARQAGLGSGEAGGSLAEHLPKIIDRLTPDGRLPAGGDISSLAGGLLGGLFAKD